MNITDKVVGGLDIIEDEDVKLDVSAVGDVEVGEAGKLQTTNKICT